MRIDLHSHFYPQEFFDLIEEAESDFSFGVDGAGVRYIAYRGARFFGITAPMSRMDLRLEAMDRAGVDKAILSVGPLPQFIKDLGQQVKMCRLLNDRYAAEIAEHPDRLGAYGTVPMLDTDAALTELERVIDTLRFNGIILPSNIEGAYYDDPRFEPFLQEADRRGLCVFIHPLLAPTNASLREYVLGPIVGFMFDTTISVARLAYSGVLGAYPRIRWHIAHAGGAIPWLMERIDNGWRDYAENRRRIEQLPSTYLKNLYFDTVTFSPYALRMLRDLVGTDHMVLGTDFPHPLGGIDKGVSTIQELDIPEYEKENIFSRTALSILNNV